MDPIDYDKLQEYIWDQTADGESACCGAKVIAGCCDKCHEHAEVVKPEDMEKPELELQRI